MSLELARLRQNAFLVLGRAGIDLYADPPGTRLELSELFTSALGGSAANIAAAICRLGGSASLVTTVSDDAVGRFIHNQLVRYEIGTQYVATAGGEVRSSLAVVETRNEDCQSVIYRNGAADFALTMQNVTGIRYGDFGALVVTGTSLAMEPSRSATFHAMALARKAGLPVILDIDYRPYSWANADDASVTCLRAGSISDIVVGNDIEFAVMAGVDDGLSLARNLARDGARICVYKMGKLGSITFSGFQSFETGIYAVEALKPTGAGDAFMGGFLTGLAGGLSLEAAVQRGSAAAAIVVTRVGCAPAMPTASELANFIAGQPARC